MRITEVRVKLVAEADGRLRAYCSVLLEGAFAVRDIKVIEGRDGLFLAMPSRKLSDHCHNCGTKNHLRSRFCNQCGCRLDENRALRDSGAARLHADVAHPVNAECREAVRKAVLEAYRREVEASKLPGYVCRYDGEGLEREADAGGRRSTPPSTPSPRRPSAPRPAPTASDRLPVRGRAS